MTNKEKWEGLIVEARRRGDEYIQSIFPETPEKFYTVYPTGVIKENFVTGSHYTYEFSTYYSGKVPSNDELKTLQTALSHHKDFVKERIYFDYCYIWDKDSGSKANTAIKGIDLFSNQSFLTLESAQVASAKTKMDWDANIAFDEVHKKTANYDYNGNGYKFLGWQNGWKHFPMDKEGNVIVDGSKAFYYGYRKEDYPEYGECREAKHRLIEVSHNNRGSEHTVSCPICKIFYKYDSSD